MESKEEPKQVDENHPPSDESPIGDFQSTSRNRAEKVPLPITVAFLIGFILLLLPKFPALSLLVFLIPAAGILLLLTILSFLVYLFTNLKNRAGGIFYVLFWPIVFFELLLKFLTADFQGHGRPFRINGRLLSASVLSSSDWVDGSQIVLRDLDPKTRHALQAYWLHSGIAEHASVAAFSNLSLQLIALGAGPDLLRKVLEAAAQEVEHARICFSTATYFSGELVSPTGIPEISLLQDVGTSCQKVMEDCFYDGCIMESFSAALAERSGELARDSHSKTAFSLIARDEKSHGELSWEILAFFTKKNEELIRSFRAQILHLRANPVPRAYPETIADAFDATDEKVLIQFGILDQKRVNEIWQTTLSKADERIGEWLCSVGSSSDNGLALHASTSNDWAGANVDTDWPD